MSDDDFMQQSDEEYEFEFDDEDEEEEDSANIDIENKYYNAKQIKASEPDEAIKEFLEVTKQQEEKGDWGFKGLKQAIKLEFKLQRYDEVRPREVALQRSTHLPNDRQLLTMKSSSHTSSQPLHATTQKSPSTTCWTILRKAPTLQALHAAWRNSIP